MDPKVIAVIGGLAIDMIMVTSRVPLEGESLEAMDFTECLGGKGANSAIAAHRSCHRKDQGSERPKRSSRSSAPHGTSSSEPQIDIEVRMIGAIGDDRYGAMHRTMMQENNINVEGLITSPGQRSHIYFVIVENDTRENRLIAYPSATGTWKPENFTTVSDLGAGKRPDLIISQMEISREVVEAMIKTAGENKIEFILNAAPARPISTGSLRHIAHLIVNETEAATLSGREPHEVTRDTWQVIADEFLEAGVQNLIITLGERGAFYATQKESGHCQAYNVEVIDPTGAGDTFTGTYASECLRQRASGEWDIKKAVMRASKASALTIQKMGAQDGIPWADEIDKFNASLRGEKVDASAQG